MRSMKEKLICFGELAQDRPSIRSHYVHRCSYFAISAEKRSGRPQLGSDINLMSFDMGFSYLRFITFR